MENIARGYIASGEFNGNRVPQHIQNQIVKLYCDVNSLKFVLSRAEYWINGSTDYQLWAALKEGFKNIVFYSIWQLPTKSMARYKIYKYCDKNHITLHFASERIRLIANTNNSESIEILIRTQLLISEEISKMNHLKVIRKLSN